MSFGFAIGDFITVGKLAWTLYRECYKIARGAPQEFSLLVNELSTLSNSLTILQEEAKDPESTLSCAGDDRVRMVNEMIAGIEDTLNRLRKIASKYAILGSGSKAKQLWARFQWSAELSSIDRLRNKLVYHNTVMNLLLTSVGNSSLQRIESSNAALASDVLVIKNHILSNQAVVGSKVPALSVLDDDLMNTSLSASLMANAEATQPWRTIGFGQWIGTGRWWLLRAQVELHTITSSEQSVTPAAYAALIKASWILIDVIPCHPQFPLIPPSRSSELQSLSAEVKNEFSRITALAMGVPSLDGLRSYDLRLWESTPVKTPLIRPYRVSQDLDEWRDDGGEHVLFRGFAFHEADPVIPCILLFLVHESAKAARLVAQDQYDNILRAIALPNFEFLQNTIRDEYDKSVTVGKEKFEMNHAQEAQVLWNMAEATNFYIVGRRTNHASLEDLKAYMLLTAIKNGQEQAAMQIRQEICKTDNIVESDQKGSLVKIAASINSELVEDRRFWDDPSDWSYLPNWEPRQSLLDWAVVYNYNMLIEFILSEDPIIDMEYINGEYVGEEAHALGQPNPMILSAEFGNELVMRWCLSNLNYIEGDVSKSLYKAIEGGHTNVVALLVGARALYYEEINHITRQTLQSPLSELVIHAILAVAYATKPESKSSLRRAADRGHEGAIVLLSYTSTMNEVDEKGYLSRTHDSGCFDQVVAVLARLPNILPAFDLTLMTVERRRTQVLLKVVDLPPWLDTRVYLDSYHAYVENVPEGLSETHKKVIKIGTNGEFQITIVHQEKILRFTVWNEPDPRHDYSRKHFPWGPRRTHAETFTFNIIEERRVEIPIKIDMENPASVFNPDRKYTSLDPAPHYVLHHDVA